MTPSTRHRPRVARLIAIAAGLALAAIQHQLGIVQRWQRVP